MTVLEVRFNASSVSQLLHDQFPTSIIKELVLLKEVTFIEWSKTMNADLPGLQVLYIDGQ